MGVQLNLECSKKLIYNVDEELDYIRLSSWRSGRDARSGTCGSASKVASSCVIPISRR